MTAIKYLFAFFVFPGLIFSATMGLLVGWVDRKVTAKLQWRVGPPWYQNFADMAKLLLYKETLVPQGVSRALFFGMPLVAVSAAALVSTILFVVNGAPRAGFIGDLIVVVYLLMIPSITMIMGGFASRNSLASLGSSRELKLLVSYELPFILALLVPVTKCGFTIRLGGIIMDQAATGPVIASASGVIAFIAMMLCIQAKLGFVPFDMPEAETEIMSGLYIEYSGKGLGMFKMARAIVAFLAPVLLITLFFGGIKFTIMGFLGNIIQYIGILVIMIVIKNTNPRVRIDQAMRFFWTTVSAMSVIALALAYLGM
jgi:NADH-quinone oxidoreductase subunit H